MIQMGASSDGRRLTPADGGPGGWRRPNTDLVRSSLRMAEVDEVCALIADGNYTRTAVQIVGKFAIRSLHRWIQKGEADPDSIYGEVTRRVRQAEAAREQTLLALVKKGTEPHGDRPGDWRAAAWMLERLHPERYSASATVRHEGSIDHMIRPSEEIALEALSDDQLEQLRTLIGLAQLGRDRSSPGEAETDGFRALYDAEVSAELASSPDRECARKGANGRDQ
jgi:hypothetical protein